MTDDNSNTDSQQSSTQQLSPPEWYNKPPDWMTNPPQHKAADSGTQNSGSADSQSNLLLQAITGLPEKVANAVREGQPQQQQSQQKSEEKSGGGSGQQQQTTPPPEHKPGDKKSFAHWWFGV